ncbi:outer membrane protein, partial [Alteraurantiacibacter palmitatis]
MKKFALGLGVAAVALSAPAMARDGQGYFGVDVGAVFPNEYELDVTTNAGVAQNAVLIEGETGWEVAGVLGYDFGPVRAELEGSYKEWDPTLLTSTVIGIPRTAEAVRNGNFFTGTSVAGGELRLTSVMANALVDFGGDEGVGLSVGGGFGHTWMSGETSIYSPGPGYIDDADHTWAWQAIAALRVPASRNFDVGLKYKYFNTNTFNVTDSQGRATSFSLATH